MFLQAEALNQLSRQCEEMMQVNDELKQDNFDKEREIRRLIEETEDHKEKIENIKNEMSRLKECSRFSKNSMKDCANNTEIGSERKDMNEQLTYGRMLKDEADRCEERIQELELTLKTSCDNIRALRKVNVALSEELHALRRVCTALDEQCRAATLRSHFKDDIIREMRRQLKQAKIKIRDSECASTKSSLRPVEEDSKYHNNSYGSVNCSTMTARMRRHRLRNDAPLHPDSEDEQSVRNAGSGDDGHAR